MKLHRMKSALQTWVTTYPADRAANLPTKRGSASNTAIMETVPEALREQLVYGDRFTVQGSNGSGNWAEISWVAVVDSAISTSTQEGFYPTYLLSADGKRLVLSIQQGSNLLGQELGKRPAMAELKRRAAMMLERAPKSVGRLNTQAINLGAKPSHRHAPLFEAGHVLGRTYDAADLPEDNELIDDFRTIVQAHVTIAANGGTTPIENIVSTAKSEGLENEALPYVKRYNLHRVAERNNTHSKRVKAHYPDVCMGCDTDYSSIYGDAGKSMLDAHHLTAIANLAEDEKARFTVEDFAVLCPNCHRIIHRLIDSGDLRALRRLLGKD